MKIENQVQRIKYNGIFYGVYCLSSQLVKTNLMAMKGSLKIRTGKVIAGLLAGFSNIVL